MSRTATARKPTLESPNGTTNGTTNGVPATTIDLADLFASETAVIEITDPRDVGKVKRDTGMRVEVSSVFTPEAKAAAVAHRDKLTLVDGKVDTHDPAFIENLLEQVIAVTRRWWAEPDSPDGLLIAGETVPCAPEHVRRLYTDPRTEWFYHQVRDGYLEIARFFGVPRKTH